MKAIILAGGEGSRLRPISLLRPKPMVRLLDRPLLEHIVLLLREHGFDDICMTLHYLPQCVQDWFGDGQELGVSIRYQVETTPLGTAGGVRACADFYGGDDVLVISGDAACDADLSAFLRFHRERGGAASLLVQQSREPLEYGLVLTDRESRVRGFLEKPSPDRIYTDLVNTGIYLLSPVALNRIPSSCFYDFGSSLFPALLAEGQALYAWENPGYWNDIGSCDAYLRSCFDALDGRLALQVSPSQAIACTAPCWISPLAEVDPGAQIGPYAVVGADSRIGPGCRVEHSVLEGAVLEPGCDVTGSILCSGVFLGTGTQVREGCVLADGVTVGAGSFLQAGVRVWPGKTLSGGTALTHDLVGDRKPLLLRFDPDACLRGRAGTELTPEVLLRMGLSGSGLLRCGAAADGGSYSALLASAFLTGCGAAGRAGFHLGGVQAAAAAWAAYLYHLDLTLHIHQSGDTLTLRFFDRNGLPLSRKHQRDLEASLSAAPKAALPASCAEPQLLTGVEEAHIAAAAMGCGSLEGLRIAVTGGSSLRAALRQRGAVLCPPEDGLPSLRLSEDGFTLEGVDELGRHWDWPHLLCALLMAELRGGRCCLCLPYSAPEAAEKIAEAQGKRLYRLGRDGDDALEIWRKKPYARDGLFLALRLCSWLCGSRSPVRGKLSELMALLPDYATQESLLEVHGDRAQLLRELGQDYEAETVSGLKLHTEKGCATISADTLGRLRIFAESTAMEAAGELCSELRRRLRELDA